jgi:protein-L-isoaspartate(D-aspartate) O-methyltransferase
MGAREAMLEDLRRHGLRHPGVLKAMADVPREEFVPDALRRRAFDDGALPIEGGQTISQPFVVAHMAAVADPGPDDRVLEVGTGSGYGAAVLSRLAGEVVTVERLPQLAASARERLAALGYLNVTVVEGDGTLGWPERSPYQAIVVTAAGPSVPPTLVDQLAPGGRLVMPVGTERGNQDLMGVERHPDGRVTQRALGPVAFVPLIGEEGFHT